MKRYGLSIIAAVVILAIPVGAALVQLYTDWLWFIEVKYTAVFTKVLVTQIQLGALFGLACLLLLLINIVLANALCRNGFPHVHGDIINLPGTEMIESRFKTGLFVVTAFASLVMGLQAASRWMLWLTFKLHVPFGTHDPVFGRDISFYVFKLPFFDFVLQWLSAAILFSGIASVAIYVIRRGIVVTPIGVEARRAPVAHLSVVAAVLFCLKVVDYRLALYHLLTDSNGMVSGAGYTDVHLRIPVLSALAVVAALAAVGLLAAAALRSWKVAAGAIAVYIIFACIGAAAPPLYQKFRVQPNEILMESPYIQRQIDATRSAFHLDRITVKSFPAEDTITPAQIRDNLQTIRNIRLWDARPLLSTYNQLQAIRPYYNFTDVDVDRYHIGDRNMQVNVSVRELSYDKLPSRIWINEHLTYTHGYGLVMSPVTHTSTEGMPDFLVKDIPPATLTGLALNRPEIYYGETGNDYVFVKTKSKEFDYPLGDTNQFTSYAGAGGVPMRNFARRLAFSIRFSSLGIVLNTGIGPDSRVMFYRAIADRVRRIMPVVSLDSNPYPVLFQGRIVWIIDGYTLSENYPYSKSFGGLNYIRNSVKVTVDAYDGSVNFYVADPTDPIIRTYSRIFPGVFRPLASMPPALREHLRYPVDYFKIQSRMFLIYHMTIPQVFYNKEDQWDSPREIFYQEEQELEPYFTIMKLPGRESEEYTLVLPFTPVKKDNLAALMCARMDGTLELYRFPKKKLIYGPFQIEARIDQDTDISKQFSLWNQRGSQIIRGNLLVVPIAQGLLYVEPVYLMAEKGQIPELKRVITSIGDQVTMDVTLKAALERIVGGDVGLPGPGAGAQAAAAAASSEETGGETPSENVAPEQPEQTGQPGQPAGGGPEIPQVDRARRALAAARDASKRGDWVAFGRAMQQLEDILNQPGKKK